MSETKTIQATLLALLVNAIVAAAIAVFLAIFIMSRSQWIFDLVAVLLSSTVHILIWPRMSSRWKISMAAVSVVINAFLIAAVAFVVTGEAI